MAGCFAASSSASLPVPSGELSSTTSKSTGTGSDTQGWTLFDNQGFGQSAFDQTVTYQRALEGELTKTIQGMNGVASARVSIVLAQTGALSSEDTPASAAVVLAMSGNATPSTNLVEAIVNTISKSVQGLSADNVVVTDDQGHTLAGSTSSVDSAAAQAKGLVEQQTKSKIDTLLDAALGPNHASVAVSADGKVFLWAPQGAAPSYSQDSGATWPVCEGISAGAKVAADRGNPSKFYASDRNGMYLSLDGGATFVKVTASPSGRPRPVFGIEGDVWVPTGTGLFHSQDSAATFTQVQPVNGASAVGFGMPAPGQTYPAVYLAGSVADIWGTYRSDDAGATWQRIDDPQHQFGYINCLTGDQRQYGRVYLGTGGRGILYGDLR